MARDYNVQSRLMIDGAPVAISGFTVDFPAGVIGSRMSCELADPVGTIPDPTAVVLFQVGVSTSGSDPDWVTVMDLGVVNSVSESVKWLGDSRNWTAVSGIADRWDYAPVRPEFLYDPLRIDPITSSEASPGDLVDSDHQTIFPVLTALRSLDLVQLMNYVYVKRLGFSRVVTNIPNFSLNFVNIPVTGSFHSVVTSEIGIFEPVYCSDDSDTLWIIDPQGTLPVGLPIRHTLQKHYAQLTRQKQQNKLVNAVVLTYRDTLGDGPVTSRAEQETQEVGAPFTEDWQRTTVTRFINDFHDNPGNTSEVTRSVVTRILTQVQAWVSGVTVEDGVATFTPPLTRVVLTEDQRDTFLYDFRLKTGYSKETSLYTILPGESAKLRQVQTEESQIVWESRGTPGEFIKRYEVVSTSGLFQRLFDPTDPSIPEIRESIFSLNRRNSISPDPGDPASAVVESGPLSTQIDSFRVTGQDQIEVGSQRVNHLTGTTDSSHVFQHTGTIYARATSGRATTVNMVLTRGTQPRRVPGRLNAGNVPFPVALTLANRILDRQGAGPVQVDIEFSGLDLSLRRGSLRRVEDRGGNFHVVFITGFSITGANLGQRNFSVVMKAQGVVIGE